MERAREMWGEGGEGGESKSKSVCGVVGGERERAQGGGGGGMHFQTKSFI